ncbi:MAG: hypothetical protein RR893_12925, partial [Clostridia bacterium]
HLPEFGNARSVIFRAIRREILRNRAYAHPENAQNPNDRVFCPANRARRGAASAPVFSRQWPE